MPWMFCMGAAAMEQSRPAENVQQGATTCWPPFLWLIAAAAGADCRSAGAVTPELLCWALLMPLHSASAPFCLRSTSMSPRADLPRPSPTADAALQVRRKLGLVALPAPSSPMLALPGVPGATPGGKALALRREGAGASSEELRGVLMPPRHKGLVPAIRGAHALHIQGALGRASLVI